MFTPNEIEVLIHCHISPTKHPRYKAPAVQEALNKLLTMSLIDGSINKREGNYWETTEKGAMLVKMLCDTPLPEKIYIDPRKG